MYSLLKLPLQKGITVVLLTALMVMLLVGCGNESQDDSSATEGSEIMPSQVEETSGDSETATEATQVAGDSEWETAVIDGGITINEVHAFAGGLIGMNSMQLYYSADGINWELTKDLSPFPFYDAFLAGGQMVVYDSDNAHFSSDGKSWTSSPRQVYHLFNTAMHDGSKFIDVDTGYLGTSEDGLKYLKVRADINNPLSEVYFQTASGYAASISKLALYDGVYYAVGDGIWSSTDLYTWTQDVTIEELVYTAEDLLFNGETFLVPASYAIYTFDGSNITSGTHTGNVYLVHDGKFIAIFGNGASSKSTDGITWEPLFAEDSTSFTAYCSVVFNGKLFVYGEDGNMRYADMK